MLFQFQGKPQRLARLFKLFKGMAPRLREYRSRYGWAVALASPAYAAVCVVALSHVDGAAVGIFLFFAVCGMLFLLWGWALGSVLQRYPCNRKTIASRVLSVIALLAMALMGSFAAYANGAEWLGESFSAVAKPQALAMWGLASLGVFLSGRWIVWLRLRDEMIQDHELDFLYKLVLPLIRDLPPDAACTFSCNPFTPMWSEKFSTESLGMRRFEICDDVLLDFKVKLDEEALLVLRTVCRRVAKYKSTGKKTKSKGTKHRVAMVCRYQHPVWQVWARKKSGN